MQLRSILSFALPLLLAACGDAQVGSDYPGESLLTVQGTIVNELGEAPAGPVDAVLVWNIQGGSDNENFPVRATATGSFPASFTLSIHEPPPEQALNDLSKGGLVDTRVGIATVRAALSEDDADGEPSSLGVDEHHVIVYVESEMDEDGFWSNFFGGALDPGFHVMDAFPRKGGSEVDTELKAAFDACNAAATTEAEHNACFGYDVKLKIRPSAAGPSTKLTVRMAPSEDLEYPDWH
ncbi:hypothetical protein BE04_41915 [Sorangium cellulosum]|uniref:Secreted protein n=2 Tax=Sorangium cellulosum TaxID=56 RepID=A0A150PTL8_SORCE|nr:hypothetical protein [Sorangium cellulosum]AGP40441.1 hypothetical protein SCE1572_41615 [Sorangium cellulosum So0157-2]KYF59020.1 hypothetical protein BE04_41915 [Sorangium cellulosum]